MPPAYAGGIVCLYGFIFDRMGHSALSSVFCFRRREEKSLTVRDITACEVFHPVEFSDLEKCGNTLEDLVGFQAKEHDPWLTSEK